MNCTRRSFLSQAAAPAILTASKSGSRKPLIGEGDHQYEVHHDWGELPPGLKYGNTHGVCEDAQGHIYVHHTVHAASESADTMVVFDKKGRFVRSWGREFKGGAHGLHVRKEGREEFLYLCDTQQAIVVKTTLRGEIVWKLDYPEESPAYEPGSAGKRKKYSPTNVAVAPNGDVYVADGYGSNYINQYDYNGKFIRSFGGTGKEAGQVSCPHGLIVDLRSGQPELLVADRTNKRLQWFSMDGKHLRFGEGVILPCHFHERKGVMVIPDLQSRVTLLGRDNKVIAHLGENPEPFNNLRKQPRGAFPEAKFICPHGACFDRDGNIFVVEWVEVGRVTKLRKV